MNVILFIQKICTSLWVGYQRKTDFVLDVSIKWATNRNWQTKVLDKWKVTPLNLPCQESGNDMKKAKLLG